MRKCVQALDWYCIYLIYELSLRLIKSSFFTSKFPTVQHLFFVCQKSCLPTCDQSPHTRGQHKPKYTQISANVWWWREKWVKRSKDEPQRNLTKTLTIVGMLLHLLAGGIRVRRSGLRLMLMGGGLFSCMFLETPGDIRPGDAQWL